MMDFKVISDIVEIEIIAIGSAIRELPELQERFGHGRWRKLKGVAVVCLSDGTTRRVELHWYEAHGIGKKRLKIKRFLDEQ